jgi:hypothetical protein
MIGLLLLKLLVLVQHFGFLWYKNTNREVTSEILYQYNELVNIYFDDFNTKIRIKVVYLHPK